MTPEMWLELEPIKHRCHAQLAAVRQNPSGDQHGVALLLHWLSRSTLEIVCHPPSCGLVPRLGGLGRQNFSRSRLARRTLHTQPAALKALHWNLLSVVPHARGVVENLFSTASGPVSTVLRSRSGAAFCCWLGTWFHTTLLCCNGPCPHDPPRCRLNSSPSHRVEGISEGDIGSLRDHSGLAKGYF